jgi:hypothetical protein
VVLPGYGRAGRGDAYRRYIREAGYGELAEPFDTTTFWLDGSLQISAQEQVAFLKQVVRRQLPFDAENYATLKAVMLAERTPDYALYAKTGWAARATPQIGWYVGYVETPDDTWVFATNITVREPADLALRPALAKASSRPSASFPPRPEVPEPPAELHVVVPHSQFRTFEKQLSKHGLPDCPHVTKHTIRGRFRTAGTTRDKTGGGWGWQTPASSAEMATWIPFRAC